MAVSQVEALKNPCRLWMWNSLVAAQPPRSAPATPIRQVTMRPCDLLPGISILASRPAPSPRTIQAMIPIAGLLAANERMAGLVPHRGQGWPGRAVAIPGRLVCHYLAKLGLPAGETARNRKAH